MPVKRYLLLTALMVLLAYVVPARTSNQVDVSAEEYAVHSAAITEMFFGEKVPLVAQARMKLLVIQDATAANTDREKAKQDDPYFRKMFLTLAAGVVKDYQARNNEPARLKESFKLKVKYVLAEKQEIERIFKGGGWWEDFYERYPGSEGLIILSRVGFDAGMNQALVYFHHWCGPKCGRGYYLLLEKSSDRWQVVQRKQVWIS
jgi:hypothetical protein